MYNVYGNLSTKIHKRNKTAKHFENCLAVLFLFLMIVYE